MHTLVKPSSLLKWSCDRDWLETTGNQIDQKAVSAKIIRVPELPERSACLEHTLQMDTSCVAACLQV